MSNKIEAAKLIERALSLLPASDRNGANGRALRSVINNLKPRMEVQPKNVFNPMDGSFGPPKSRQFDPATGRTAYLSKDEVKSIFSRIDRMIAAKNQVANPVQTQKPTTFLG